MKVIKQLSLNPSFSEQFFWKDCSLKFLQKKLDPQLVAEIEKLTQLGFNNLRRYVTYDIGYQVFEAGDKSCRNPGWHVDGVDNQYLMYIVGDFRTEFAQVADAGLFPEDRSKLLEFNSNISKADFLGISIPNSTLVSYTSKDIHRGRIADQSGARFFLRVCNSNYLRPSNKDLMR